MTANVLAAGSTVVPEAMISGAKAANKNGTAAIKTSMIPAGKKLAMMFFLALVTGVSSPCSMMKKKAGRAMANISQTTRLANENG